MFSSVNEISHLRSKVSKVRLNMSLFSLCTDSQRILFVLLRLSDVFHRETRSLLSMDLHRMKTRMKFYINLSINRITYSTLIKSKTSIVIDFLLLLENYKSIVLIVYSFTPDSVKALYAFWRVVKDFFNNVKVFNINIKFNNI